jgi:hypothetical protein
MHLFRTSVVSAPGKPSPLRLPLFLCHFIGAEPPHPTSFPVCRSQSFTRAQSRSPTRRTGTLTVVGLRLSVVRPPHFDSAPGPCQAGVPRSMDACRGHLPAGRPVTGRHWQRHTTHCAPCEPRRGLSTASASSHAVPGDAPSLGSTSVHNLVIG